MINYLYTAKWFLPFRWLLSVKYGFLIALRNHLYDFGIFKTHKVKTPVISVGNISTGGSGKTILVQSLIHHFLDQKLKPAVLSRGYGRASRGLVVVADNHQVQASISRAGDEPFLIAQNFPGTPVVVSENRVEGARYIENHLACDVIILDDGFQHRRLHRDVDILIVDFPEQESQHLLPWGILREPQSNISRADILIYSKKGQVKNSAHNLILDPRTYVLDHAGERINLNKLDGDFGLFAGLGKPAIFFDQIETLIGPAQARISFPDHAIYSKPHLDHITSISCDYWITTQKDYVKLDPLFCEENQVYCMGVKAKLPTPLFEHLKRHFN